MTVAATIAVLAIIGLAVHRLHRGGGVTRLLALLGLLLLADRALRWLRRKQRWV